MEHLLSCRYMAESSNNQYAVKASSIVASKSYGDGLSQRIFDFETELAELMNKYKVISVDATLGIKS